MAIETSFISEETFTQEEFRRWLDRLPAADAHRYELIGGRIVMTPPAGGRHGGVGSHLNWLLRQHVLPNGLGRVFDSSTGFELPSGATLEPDLAFLSRERWELGPRPEGSELIRMVPNLVIEILSPSTARRDRTEKLEIYAQNRVDEYWIVDLGRRELSFFQRRGEAFAPAVTLAGGRIPSAVLPGLEVRVEDVFAELD